MIETPEQLRWLMESASGEALSNCYVLDLPSKSIDITSWTDTGIGACAQPATIVTHHENCAGAFTGGLEGNGTAIRFRIVEKEGDGAKGGMGLFPCLRGAYVTGLTLDVTVDGDEPLNGYNSALTGAVCSYAGPLDGTPTVIDGISVTQRFIQRVWNGAVNTGKTNSSSWSAGIAGFNDEGSVIQNCSVVTERNLTESGTPAERNVMWAYAGIALVNAGTLNGCSYRYAAGDNGTLVAFGGMSYQNTGDIFNCSADVQAQGLFVTGGGLVDAMDGGTMSGCTAAVNIEGKDDPEYGSVGMLGGLVGQAFWIGKDKDRGDYYLPPKAVTISDCTASGNLLSGTSNVGGIVGLAGIANDRISPYPCTIKDCTVKIAEIGTREKTSAVGGIVGSSQPSSDVTIENCVSYADVYGDNHVGGLVGSVQYREGERSFGTAERPTRFTMTDSHNYGGRVETAEGGGNVGGAIGFLSGWDGYFDTFISGCSSSADVTAGDLAGGFAGMFSVKEPEVKSAGRPYTFYDCHAYGNVSAISKEEAVVGGFLGLSHKNAHNLIVKSCSASGDVYSARTFAGGFLGGDAWKNQPPNNVLAKNSYIDCSASGSVTVEMNGAGGFVGYIAQSPNLTFTGCSASGDVVAKNQHAGGFGGEMQTPATFTDCSASGNASAIYTVGGFIARAVESAYPLPGAKFSFTRCYAYGDVTADASSDSVVDSLKGAGGFGGRFESGSFVAVDCAAYGSVQGVTVGGFLGFTDNMVTALEFTRCEAYGDVNVNAKGEVGGFAGYIKGAAGVTAVFTKCASYGSVKNCDAAQTDFSDCAGFISCVSMKVAIDGCASYAPSVVGRDACSAAFVTLWDASANSSIIRNCSYTGFGTDKKDKMTQAWGSGTAIPAANLVNNKFLEASAVIPANPKTATVNCVKSNDNGLCKLSVTFGAGASYKLKELAVSTDGGKTYTQLVSGGKVVAGVLPESSLTGTNFAYTYRAPYSADFKVRIDAEVTRTVNAEKRTAPFKKIF